MMLRWISLVPLRIERRLAEQVVDPEPPGSVLARPRHGRGAGQLHRDVGGADVRGRPEQLQERAGRGREHAEGRRGLQPGGELAVDGGEHMGLGHELPAV